jgi:hypothetical protein
MPSSAFIRLAAYHCTVTAIPHLVTASPLALDFANTYTPCRKHRTTIFVCAICCMPLPSKPPAAVNTNRCRQHQQQRCAATQRLQGGGAGKAGFSWPHTITTLHTAPSHHHHHHYSTHTGLDAHSLDYTQAAAAAHPQQLVVDHCPILESIPSHSILPFAPHPNMPCTPGLFSHTDQTHTTADPPTHSTCTACGQNRLCR